MASSKIDAEIIIIGAGLSGLASALLLVEAGKSVRVVEARNKPGGRIRSVFDGSTGQYLADLGPTWIWPAFQPVISRWIDKLGLETFPQFESGNAVLDHGPDTQSDIRFLPGQDGNVRIVGGLQAIIDRLVAVLPEGIIMTAAAVREVAVTRHGAELRLNNRECPLLKCERVIVAVPPRIAAKNLCWNPELPSSLTRALMATPTWMAPHAKVVALYEEAFWRRKGLSGRIASQVGPIVEGHDHSGSDGLPGAIFGFIGWPHEARVEIGQELKLHIQAQLKRCFGPESPEPLSLHIEDWASDPLVASPRDLREPMSHPDVGPDILRQAHFNDRIWFAVSESAERSPGLVEGAFDAAERTSANITNLKALSR